MATASRTRPQDMPPPGGYGSIPTSRVALRRIVTPTVATALTVTSLVVGGVAFFFNLRDVRRETVELMSARHVLQPILLAERDREFLKQLRRNREEERELMKDYPGWVVGTYFGQPVYKNVPEEKLVEPDFHEYTVHASLNDTQARYFRYLWT